MFCTTVIPTIGRSTLSRAVESVLNQTVSGACFEVIVVNDAGRDLPSAPWQQDARVRVVATQRRERSVARNTGAALARGKYLHFLDDDDWLLPTALQTFWQVAQTSQAEWLYGGARLDDAKQGRSFTLHLERAGNCFIQAIAGEWIPLQASLIDAALFFAVGGFNPLATPGEDKDLCPRLAMHASFAYTTETVAVIDHGAHSTTNLALGYENSRSQREKILDEARAFSRMIDSCSNGYWHGRAVRIYAASLLRNLRRQRLWLAASRACFMLAALLAARRSWAASDFWQALAKPHLSRVVGAKEL